MAQITLNSSGVASNGALVLQSNGTTTAVTIDTAQNMGLGVTPSAWKSNYKAVQVGNAAAVAGRTDFNTNYFSSNWYVNSSNQDIYQNTGHATIYSQGSGTHAWYTAASGTAGNAISFTQAMTLDASGNLGIGTSSPSARLSVSDTANPKINLLVGGTERAFISYTTATTIASFDSDSDITLSPNNTEAVRVNAAGNLLVGITSQIEGGKLSVSGSNAIGVNITGVDGGGINANYTAGSGTAFYGYWKYGGALVGYITSTGSTVNYTSISDYRLKNTIEPMTGALAKVAQLKPCTYKWNSDGSDGQGFIAHELAEVVPDCVVGEKDAVDAEGNPQYQGIDTSFLVATLTAAIQEQQAIITQLQADVEALKGTA